MYAIVDIDDRGYADNHRITEIAIYHHNGIEVTDHFYTLVNQEENSAIHRRLPALQPRW